MVGDHPPSRPTPATRLIPALHASQLGALRQRAIPRHCWSGHGFLATGTFAAGFLLLLLTGALFAGSVSSL